MLAKNKNFLILFFINIFLVIFLVSSCASVKREIDDTFSSNNEHMIMSVLWTQKSAEYRALCYQAYNIAKLRLDQALMKLKKDKKNKLKPAVVLDLDETVLDNSLYRAKLITANMSYPNGLKEWEGKALATAVPGALEFSRYAESKKVSIFYLTKRKIENEEATVVNLTKLGFPVNKESLIMHSEKDASDSGSSSSSSSIMRNKREEIMSNRKVILFIGDDLSDFSDIFERGSVADRFKEVDRISNDFGNSFVMLPNPMYGSWEETLHGYKNNNSNRERAQNRLKALITY
ncbi:MAG: 5'-nucleotidase, lipoprotein e(P4) family [Oligoflexia bacterium]|nr:5'-nucleotidase, lipoprotein e(P4) family [Oligoflexia bacterium]